MSNVIPLDAARKRNNSNTENSLTATPAAGFFQYTKPHPVPDSVPDHRAALDELDIRSSEYLAELLRIDHHLAEAQAEAHRRKETLDHQLELTAYLAHLAGVPEQDIHELCEYTADALDRAIRKVQARA